MNIREFLLEKPQENNIISFLQDGASQSENQNTSEYLSNLKNEVINDFYKNKDKYAKEYEKYNFKDQNLTNPMGNISEYKRDLYDYNKNPSMNADDLSNYILDKQSKFNASKPIFTDDNEVARKNNQFMRDLGDELQKSGRGKLLQDDDGSYWVQDNNGNYSKVQGSTMGNLYRGLRDNGASVALGTAGAIGGSMLGGGVGMVAGGALGASLGAGYDYYGNTKDTNQDANLKEALMLMGENAGLSLIGDAAFAGVAKGARVLKNTYNMTKTGARAGKDMIDGMAVKGGNLGNRVIDKITQKDIPMIGKFTDGGLQNAETIFNNLTKNVENKKQIDELIAKENPTYLENGKPTIEILKNIVEQGLNKNNPQFIQDSAKRTSAILKNISNTLQGVPTTQRREILLKSAQAYPEIGSFLDDVLKADRDASISFLNIIKGQDEVFKNKTGLNGEFDVKAWQKDNSSYKKRINNEYAQAIKSIDELNNGSIRLSKEDLAKIEEFKNNNFLEQDIKTNISSFLEDAIDKDLSAEQIFNLRSAINKQLATGNKTYNTKEAYRLVKDTLDETMIKNASDKELAKKILEDANKNYALKENFNNSYLGKIKDQETPEALAQRIANGARNINEDKDLKRAFEGMNEAERKANEKHAFNALLAKHRIEDIGYDFKNLAKDMDNVEFVSKDLKYAKEVVNVYAKIYQNNKDLIMTALASSGKKTNSSIATTIQGVFDRILISGVFARIHALVPFMKSAKEQALRNQILDALKLAKTNKEVISNLKNIKIADKEQSRIFKDALDNYIKVDKEQNKILKDALIKEGVIKGDNFFMDKADPSKAKSDYTAKFNVEKWINNVSGILKDEWVVNLKAMAKKHPEMFKNEADVFKVIKEIKDNPTHFFKNYDDEVALIAKPLKDDKVGNIAIKKDSGKIIHINKTKGKDLERLNRRNKAMLTGTPTPATTKGSTTNVEGDLLQHSFKNSTQTKPKKNLMDDIKENIKAKEVEKKNKKSVKQRLDEKIQNDKKASEDILKRYDDFLKENKDYNLDFLGNLDVVTREFILNAKKKTYKGKKADIPDLMRFRIEKELNIQALKEFGKNYAEYYHDGKGALQKLLIEKQGQVAGAFHRKDLGDIDLVWGAEGSSRSDGYGLSKIVKYHNEVLHQIDNIINEGELKRDNKGRLNIEYKNSIIGLRDNWKGEKNKNHWIITSYSKR
ncbi:putative barnase/colicin E5 family endoribonuclease [Campylobacter coli]|uniref:putative barnase/colicin E5 family endoribonuclease n=1 Tax=Campylobacter coli TaxID=195 RepID=UPI0040338D3E